MTALPLVSVVVIGYRRPRHLEETITTLLETTSYPKLELILCDDGSPPEMQAQMRRLPFDRFLMAEKNQGMGANTNKGILAASGDYILHLQDDWRCVGPPDFLEKGLQVLDECPEVGLVRFHLPEQPIPCQDHALADATPMQLLLPHAYRLCGRYAYSDRPHLKRRSFHDQLGLYALGQPPGATEVEFCKRVDAVSRPRLAQLPQYDAFIHTAEGTESFNETMLRRERRTRLLAHPLTRQPARFYLFARNGARTLDWRVRQRSRRRLSTENRERL